MGAISKIGNAFGLSDESIRYYKRLFAALISGNLSQKVSPIDIQPGETSVELNVGTNYVVNENLGTFEFTLPNEPSDGIIDIIFTTDSNPNITFDTTATIYVQEDFEIEANSTYEMSIKSANGIYYIVIVKMELLT